MIILQITETVQKELKENECILKSIAFLFRKKRITDIPLYILQGFLSKMKNLHPVSLSEF